MVDGEPEAGTARQADVDDLTPHQPQRRRHTGHDVGRRRAVVVPHDYQRSMRPPHGFGRSVFGSGRQDVPKQRREGGGEIGRAAPRQIVPPHSPDSVILEHRSACGRRRVLRGRHVAGRRGFGAREDERIGIVAKRTVTTSGVVIRQSRKMHRPRDRMRLTRADVLRLQGLQEHFEHERGRRRIDRAEAWERRWELRPDRKPFPNLSNYRRIPMGAKAAFPLLQARLEDGSANSCASLSRRYRLPMCPNRGVESSTVSACPSLRRFSTPVAEGLSNLRRAREFFATTPHRDLFRKQHNSRHLQQTKRSAASFGTAVALGWIVRRGNELPNTPVLTSHPSTSFTTGTSTGSVAGPHSR